MERFDHIIAGAESAGRALAGLPSEEDKVAPAGFMYTLWLAVLAALAIFPLSATAQEAGTVKVGTQTKRTSGVITAMQDGDVACYLTLKDDRGATFKEMADFDLCAQKRALLGKTVALTYTLTTVLADERQGNPDCKKSRTVALVSAAKIVEAKSVAKAPAPGPGTARSAIPQTSFCTPTETVVFACRTGAKLVSVCASRDAARNKGYVQYRFGKPDSSDPLELMLPEGQVVPARAATGEAVGFSGGGGAWMRFRKGAFAYSVYSGIGNWGPKGEKQTKEGLLVERDGKPAAGLKCSGTATSELGPDWFEKAGVQGNNEDFAFPD